MNFKHLRPLPLYSRHLRIADEISVTENVRYSEVSLYYLLKCVYLISYIIYENSKLLIYENTEYNFYIFLYILMF